MSGDRSWLYEKPDRTPQSVMADEARYERRRAAATADVHPLGCRCMQADCDQLPTRADLAETVKGSNF